MSQYEYDNRVSTLQSAAKARAYSIAMARSLAEVPTEGAEMSSPLPTEDDFKDALNEILAEEDVVKEVLRNRATSS